MRTQLVKTKTGDSTLYVPDLDEHYHSTNGAIDEAQHVYIKNGVKKCEKQEIAILEIGLGTGLNAFLTAIYAQENQIKISYLGIEKYPLESKILNELKYTDNFKDYTEIWQGISDGQWEQKIVISEFFQIKKHKTDLITKDFKNQKFDVIYFDAFGPDKQEEMWSEEILKKVANTLAPKGILSTYTAKGIVKQRLRAAGLTVKRLSGPKGKRHIINAVNG